MLFVKEILIHVLNKICWPFLAAFFVDDLSEPVETKHQEVYQGNNHENEAKQPQNPEPGRFEPIHVRVYRALVSKAVYHVEEEGVDKQEGHGLVDVEKSGFLGADQDVADDVERAEDLNKDTGGIGFY